MLNFMSFLHLFSSLLLLSNHVCNGGSSRCSSRSIVMTLMFWAGYCMCPSVAVVGACRLQCYIKWVFIPFRVGEVNWYAIGVWSLIFLVRCLQWTSKTVRAWALSRHYVTGLDQDVTTLGKAMLQWRAQVLLLLILTPRHCQKYIY